MENLIIDINKQAYSHEIKLSLIKSSTPVQKIKITESKTVEQYARDIYPVDIIHREAMVIIFLNQANETIGYTTLSIGGVCGTVVDNKLLFQAAFACNATQFIMVHNHPSGNLNPSQSDIKITKQVKECGKILALPLLDHVILTETDHYSFANEGLL